MGCCVLRNGLLALSPRGSADSQQFGGRTCSGRPRWVTVITSTTSKSMLSLIAATLLLANCSGSDESGGTSGSAPAAPASSAVPVMPDQQTPTVRVEVVVTIKGVEVTPANQQVKAKVGQPIVFHITSDVEDQLHVRSKPEHEFQVKATSNQQFQFTVTAPGSVDVELLRLNRTIATLEVQ